MTKHIHDKQELAHHYDRFSEEYDQSNYSSGRYMPHRYREFYIERMLASLPNSSQGRILDAGCGPGVLLLSMRRNGVDAWGLDLAPSMAVRANQRLKTHGFTDATRVAVGDVERLPFQTGRFDVVIASGVLEYQSYDTPTLEEARRVLRTGGHLIVNVTNRWSYTGLVEPLFHSMKRVQAFRNGLDILKRRVFRRGSVEVIPRRRRHSPRQFERALVGFGFAIVARSYFHFAPLPVPLSSLLRPVCDPISHRMEKLHGSSLGVLGGGFLVMARKDA